MKRRGLLFPSRSSDISDEENPFESSIWESPTPISRPKFFAIIAGVLHGITSVLNAAERELLHNALYKLINKGNHAEIKRLLREHEFETNTPYFEKLMREANITLRDVREQDIPATDYLERETQPRQTCLMIKGTTGYVGYRSPHTGKLLITHAFTVSPGRNGYGNGEDQTITKQGRITTLFYDRKLGKNYWAKEIYDPKMRTKRKALDIVPYVSSFRDSGHMPTICFEWDGNGFYLHGTGAEHRIGEYASDGCLRACNLDAVLLHIMCGVRVGTPIHVVGA